MICRGFCRKLQHINACHLHIGQIIRMSMDKVRARRIAAELKGRNFKGWIVGNLIDCGKSALVLHAKSLTKIKGVIKIFDPEIVERFGPAIQLERIEREKSLSGHGHPNLVEIYDGGSQQIDDITYFYVIMEYIAGATLSDILDRLTTDDIIKIISDVANAARFLETKEIVHRDIKPDNIRIKGKKNKKAVLLDLGVLKPFKAKSITDDEFKKNFVATLRYSPPELLLREENDSIEGWRAVSFYQLGGVLHDMIMKIPLFDDYSDPFIKLGNAVQSVKPIIVNDTVPRDMICLAQNCLIKSPQIRVEVVTWDDFFTIGQGPKTLDDLKKKIRQHQVVSQSEIDRSDLRRDNLQDKSKRKLLGITEKISDSIRAECVKDKKIFPPVECRTEILENNSTAKAIISFLKYESKALYGHLSICLMIKLIDNTDDIFEILFDCKISDHKLQLQDFEGANFIQIYKAVFDLTVIKEQLIKVLYSLFYAAVEAFEIKRGHGLENSKYIDDINL